MVPPAIPIAEKQQFLQIAADTIFHAHNHFVCLIEMGLWSVKVHNTYAFGPILEEDCQ